MRSIMSEVLPKPKYSEPLDFRNRVLGLCLERFARVGSLSVNIRSVKPLKMPRYNDFHLRVRLYPDADMKFVRGVRDLLSSTYPLTEYILYEKDGFNFIDLRFLC